MFVRLHIIQLKKLRLLPDLFDGLAGICGGCVLGIVSPALLDDPASPSTCPPASLEYLALSHAKVVGARYTDALTVSSKFEFQHKML